MHALVAFVESALIAFVPISMWLGFWLLEDRTRPEPRKLIVRAFVAGMLSIALVVPLERMVIGHLAPMSFMLFLAWAAIEEGSKFLVAWLAVLRHRAVDEPIDVPIYLITTALGFSAVENTLFIIAPAMRDGVATAAVTGDLRAIGATLIHVLASAVVGGAIALAFYKGWWQKFVWGTGGVILAVVLHATFNFSILKTDAGHVLTIFAGVWVGIIFLLLALERVKVLHRPAWWEKLFTKKHY